MKNNKTKVTFPARILTLFIVTFLAFWLIPSNLVFADDGDITPPASGGAIKDLAFTGIDPIMPISGAAVAITGLFIILISLRKRQYRKWKHSLGYYTKDES